MITLTQTEIDNSICTIQNILQIPESGHWDNETKASIKNFQLRMGMPGTGIADVKTVEMLLQRTGRTLVGDTPIVQQNFEDLDASTDLMEDSLNLIEHMLPPNEYVNETINKFEYIFIHHTSGWDNPTAVVEDWARDQRGRIGVHYVIGGTHINKTSKHDGLIVKCIPDKNWAYHLGSTTTDGISSYMHKHSIGIELCNFGYLTKTTEGFKTYTGAIVNADNVLDLGYKFRGYQYWHKYSPLQLRSLKALLKKISKQHSIDLHVGLYDWLKRLPTNQYYKAFEHSPDATAGKVKGVLSHTNVRKDKTDVYPHPQLIDILLNL